MKWSRAHLILLILALFSFQVQAAKLKCAETLAKVWEAKADTTSDRLKLLVSLLGRHPNIVTANLTFKRSLLETYAHVPGLQKLLDMEAASFETTSPSVRRARYLASGEAQYNQEALQKFLDARITDVEALELADGGDLGTQIRHLKQTSRRPDGQFDEKIFTRKVRRLLQVLPLIFDADGKSLFSRWEADRPNIITRIRGLKPTDLESHYGDLLKEHLSALIEEIAEEKGLGQVRVLFESMRNQFLERDLRSALTPISRDGSAVEERTLSTESLPAWVSLVRGCYGGDCSILSVPYYSLVKGAKVHFIRKGNDLSEQPVGYAFSVPVMVDGKIVPYILTVNGVTLTKVDVEMAVRLIAEDFQAKEVVLPDFHIRHGSDTWDSNLALVNTDASREGMTSKPNRKVNVAFPAGWGIVDAYMRDHQASGYRNYYYGPRIQRAYLNSLTSRDARILESARVESDTQPRYQPVEDLLQIPLIQRAVVGVQALSDQQTKVADVLQVLNLKDAQIKAARPLIELSSQRTLTLKEYRLAEEELGLSLQNILELEPGARAATLRSLYNEEPKLFVEHQARSNPKATNALIDAYGPSFANEIRSILKARDLSDAQVLKILEDLKTALNGGDLSKSIEFQRRFKGTGMEAWANETIPQAFLRVNTADTALGKKLDSALNSRQAGPTDFVRMALQGALPRESAMLQAFQEIAKTMEVSSLSYNQAVTEWLRTARVPAKLKARYIGLFLNSPSYERLFENIPTTQKQEVREAFDDFTNIEIFRKLADKGAKLNKPGIFGRLVGRTEISATTALQSGLILESFEFQAAPIPSEGAKFIMGSPPNEPGRYHNETQREVILTKQFQMQATPVTQAQWQFVMGNNPARFSTGEESLNRPVEQVSWEDVQVFIAKINELDSKWNYRLPTDAEWEFMARGGTTTAYSFGDDVSELKDFAHYHENSGSKSHPVTAKRPSPGGLYDMHGNVWEWMSDWYTDSPEGNIDPQGPESGSLRVLRGGSWDYGARDLRSAGRNSDRPGGRYGGVGFRLVRTAK